MAWSGCANRAGHGQAVLIGCVQAVLIGRGQAVLIGCAQAVLIVLMDLERCLTN